jgi:hypothetical protein
LCKITENVPGDYRVYSIHGGHIQIK